MLWANESSKFEPSLELLGEFVGLGAPAAKIQQTPALGTDLTLNLCHIVFWWGVCRAFFTCVAQPVGKVFFRWWKQGGRQSRSRESTTDTLALCLPSTDQESGLRTDSCLRAVCYAILCLLAWETIANKAWGRKDTAVYGVAALAAALCTAHSLRLISSVHAAALSFGNLSAHRTSAVYSNLVVLLAVCATSLGIFFYEQSIAAGVVAPLGQASRYLNELGESPCAIAALALTFSPDGQAPRGYRELRRNNELFFIAVHVLMVAPFELDFGGYRFVASKIESDLPVARSLRSISILWLVAVLGIRLKHSYFSAPTSVGPNGDGLACSSQSAPSISCSSWIGGRQARALKVPRGLHAPLIEELSDATGGIQGMSKGLRLLRDQDGDIGHEFLMARDDKSLERVPHTNLIAIH